MLELIPRVMALVGVFSGTMAFALQAGVQDAIPRLGGDKDPLSWAFVAVVAAVLGGCGWLVRHQAVEGVNERKEHLAERRGFVDALSALSKTQTDAVLTQAGATSMMSQELARLAAEVNDLAKTIVAARRSPENRERSGDG